MAIFAPTAMMNKRSEVSPIYYLRWLSLLICLTIVTLQSYSSDVSEASFRHFLTSSQDTIPGNPKDTARFLRDTMIQKADTFNVPLSSDSLSAPVNYKAEDSMVLEVATKKIFLYGRSEVKYTQILLNAPEIAFDQATQMVTARMTKDSAGVVVGMAKLTQAETTTVSDSIKFNFKTQKGITHNSFFQQQEIYNFAEKVKKIDAETFYAYRGRFTTCNLDTPHFAFRFKKAKFVNQKVVVTGPVHPEFEDVPIPIYLPFGIFPLSTGRHSGILPPQLTFTQDFGIGLEGLGYYKVFNDYLDAKIWSDIYSYGTWRLNFAPTYRVKYKYSGGLTLSWQNTKFAFKGDPDYSVTKTFFVTWNHSMDSKARPGVTFTANVQAGSSEYLRLVPNGAQLNTGTGTGGNYQQPVNFTNQLSSSISYQKTWQNKPYTLSVNLNHSQNTQTRLVNLNLPDIGFNVNTIYPLQPREFIGQSKWYEKLGIGYNGNIKSQVTFYDSTFQFGKLIDTMQWGAAHNIPILLSLPPLGPFQIAPKKLE
jgi:LPS-assembly protein